LLPLSAEHLPPRRRLLGMKTNETFRRGLAVAAVASALAAPAVSAAPAEQLVPSTVNDEPTGRQAPVRVVEVSADSGFDWGDAGIGASGLLAVTAIAAGAVVAIHRQGERSLR
jgi:hypothetical protein